MPHYIPPGVQFLAKSLLWASIPFSAFVAGSILVFGIHPSILSLASGGTLLCIVFLAANVQFRQFSKRRSANRLGAVLPKAIQHKYPGGVDILLHIFDSIKNRYPMYPFFEWPKTYGHTYNIRTLFDDRIFTTEPRYIKIMLASDFTRYEKGLLLHEQQEALLGDGVFNADGDTWKFHRTMTRPFFTRDRLSHFDIFDRVAEKALGQAVARLEAGYAIDWQELVLRYTLDVTTEFLLGSNVNSLDIGLSYPPSSQKASEAVASTHPASAFGEAFTNLQRIVILRSFWGQTWKLREFWKDEMSDHMKDIDGFVVPLTQEKLAKKFDAQKKGVFKRKGAEDVEEGETLVDHLVSVSDDEKLIKEEALNILIAGRDSTAASITFAIYMLAKHPKFLQRLRAEVLEHVGMRRPDHNDIKNMKYLRAVINESLRLFPPIPLNIRQTTEDVVLPPIEPGQQPIFVSAGTRMQFSVMAMQRRTDLWGPDALEFDPDRFLDERLHKYLTPNPFIFLPFGAGPRICLGQQHAYNAISFMLIRFAQRFSSIRLVQKEANPSAVPTAEWAKCAGSNGEDTVRLRSYLTLFVEGGLWVEMDREQVD